MRKIIMLAFVSTGLALAHASIKTELGQTESLAGKSEVYRLNVPVEKDIPTTEIRLVIPEGVTVSNFLPLAGFKRTVSKDVNGNITEVVWKGKLLPEEFGRFLFGAKNPTNPGTLVWKVYQKYQDGSVVAWDDTDPKVPASKTIVK